jgi:hypothetical protein
MKAWIRANAIGFPMIVLMAALILVTITWPSRREHLDFRDPVVTVPAGESTDVDAARWRVTRIQPDLTRYDDLARLDDHPKNATTLIYLVTVTGSPMPTGSPPGCAPAATDGDRRWAVSTQAAVRTWAVDRGYSGFCRPDKSFVLAFQVPTDVRIIAIDFLLIPAAEGDAAAPASRGHVIRFRVD